MTPLLAIGLLTTAPQSDTPVTIDTPEQFKGVMSSIGYTYTTPRLEAGYGSIVESGVEATIAMSLEAGDRAHGEKGTVGSFRISFELGFPKEIRTTDRPAEFGGPIEETSKTFFIGHLGKTVTVEKRIDLRHGLTRERLEQDLKTFWQDGKEFAKSHKGRFANAKATDWSKARLDDNTVLDTADAVSLGRATASWGWTWRKSWGASSNGWVFPIDVAGTEVILHEAVNSPIGRENAVFIGSTLSFSEPALMQKWTETEGKNLDWATSSGYYQEQAFLGTEIDFRGGVKLGDLRRRIQTFAAKVAALQKTIPQKSAP